MTHGNNLGGQDRSIGFFEALGMMTAVAMASDYRDWSVSEIEAHLLPALQAGQSKIYLDDAGLPVAFVTWALVDDECHRALYLDGQNPPPDRWTSGCNLWFTDIVAPSGNTLQIIRDLQRNYFPHTHAHSIKRNSDGSIKRIKVWRNVLANKA